MIYNNGMQAEKRPPGKLGAGPLVSGVVAVICLVLLMVAFVKAASPYVTLVEARKTSGDSLHLAGDLIKGTISRDVRTGLLRFNLRDTDGATVRVVFDGAAPDNLPEATRVVAIGKLEGEQFRARDLLVKCPSKYESSTKG